MPETTKIPSFIHLRVHSEYSMVDGLFKTGDLIRHCVDHQMPAVALTDQSNLCGLVRFYKAANLAGIKPIIGADCWIQHGEENPSRAVFLCKNQQGYHNLTELISKSYLEGQHNGIPVVHNEWIENFNEGLIALSGGLKGDIGQFVLSNQLPKAAERIAWWNQYFPDSFYIEIQRTGREGEADYNRTILGLAEGAATPVVATNEVMFAHATDFEAHEARVCIHQGRVLDDPRRPKDYSSQQYFRTEAEMCELFADLPSALENSVEIAKRCNLEISLGKAFLPNFPIPEDTTIGEFFAKESWAGLENRLSTLFDRDAAEFDELRKPYDERLQTELDVILQMDFPGYFLVVADFIQWSKNHDIPVGPGRGSGAGSLVAYALKITDLDPLQYNLLFERFLNPERISMPDFDVDFCMEGRDRVIEYVASKYGNDSVSQIITFGTMAAKAVIRDVGRVLGKPYGFCDQLSKMIPFDLGITLDKAFEQEEAIREAYHEDEEVREVWDLAKKLEGIIRNAGKHAGGVVIAPTKLTDFTPLYCDENGANLVAQFDKDDVEAAGLVKFDFLGLKTLTVIDWAIKNLNQQRTVNNEPLINLNDISTDDGDTFRLLQEGNTTGVFQLESPGMKKLIRQLKPSTFEDIIALVALYRPGPLGSGMDQDFVNRKHGREEVIYPHPLLEPILKQTYGTILYQEQVMQIAQILAGYSLGGADLLRRAMGKKKMEVMREQRQIFVKGASEKGIEEKISSHIFDIMEEFAKYGFNKSHSAAYALVSFQTAWLKQHFPAAFLAAAMSADMDNTDKIVTLVNDAREQGLEISPPDVNRGFYHFTISGEKTIIYGLGAIKGVGEAAIESIIEIRNKKGIFKDLFHFCIEVVSKKVNRRVLEALIKAGALDCFGSHRAELMANLEEAIKSSEQAERDSQAGQNDMFGGPVDLERTSNVMKSVNPWPENHLLKEEKEILGMYLSGHPYQQYHKELSVAVRTKLSKVAITPKGRTVIIAGLISAVRIITTKSGSRIILVTIDDQSAQFVINIKQELYQQCASYLVKDRILIVEGEVSFNEFQQQLTMRAKQLWDITSFRESRAKSLSLFVEQQKVCDDFSVRLKQQIAPYVGGTCPISIQFKANDAKAVLDLGETWCVRPSDELLYRLEDLVGKGKVNCVYP